MNERALVLTGFMGSGKSTVGALVATRMNRPFVDLDAVIVERAGRSIPALFAEGEAHFRWWEQRVLAELDLRRPLVLATGGGTLVGRWNQTRTAEAVVVVLGATLDAVRERVGSGAGRPLAGELAARYGRRFAAYGRLPHHVDTTGRTPDEVANAVIHCFLQATATSPTPEAGEMLLVPTPDGNSYPVHIQNGVAAGVGGWARDHAEGQVALITDSVVGPFWGETVRHDLLAAGLPTTLLEFPHGERHKTLATVATLYDGLLAAGVERGGAVVALGGGVVGDVAGFAAATWMRGVRGLIQLPTTLLAMVDASVGGKTGVDHPQGKNLIGAFRSPDLVLIDPTFLQTLPLRDLRGGMAEVVKHGIIGDPELFGEVASWTGGEATPLRERITTSLLARAVRVKADIVARDPFERGERARLNLGHTFGHAYEWLSGFQLSHGEAVAIGMVTAARVSEEIGLAERGLAAEIERVVTGLGLPTRWPGLAGSDVLWEAMQRDKKRSARGLRFVLPRAIGSVIVTEAGQIEEKVVARVVAAQHQGAPGD